MTNDGLRDAVAARVRALAQERWKWARQHIRELAELRREPLSRFEERLLIHWRKPLTMFEAVLELSMQLGETYNRVHRRSAARRQDFVLEVLTRLHARALLTASEVLALLRTGHASAANARWRTMHEISVVAQFLSNHGAATAERYLLFDLITREKAARNYQGFAVRLGERPLSKRTLQRLRAARARLERRFGKQFSDGDQGWAAADFNHKRPVTIRDLEEDVALPHVRPRYLMASHPVHAGPRGVVWSLEEWPTGVLPAGPSNSGLVDPAAGTLVTLNQVNATLVLRQVKRMPMDWYATYVVEVDALAGLIDDACLAFVRVQRQLEREGARIFRASGRYVRADVGQPR